MDVLLLSTIHWPKSQHESLANLIAIKSYFEEAKHELYRKLEEIDGNSFATAHLEILIRVLDCLTKINPERPENIDQNLSKNILFNEEEQWIQDAVTTVQGILFNFSNEEETMIIDHATQIVLGNMTVFPAYLKAVRMFLCTRAQAIIEACGFTHQ